MSHFPSENIGVKSMQIDVDGASPVSDDITIHTQTTFKASAIYFIDHRNFVALNSTTFGKLLYSQMSGFSFMGGLTRGSTVSGVNTANDNLFCGVNARDVNLTVSETLEGAATINVRDTFRSYWRIL
jgi:hypothetical protein